jgi:hypothetical protein
MSAAARWGGWIVTGVISLAMVGSGVMYLVGPPRVVDVFHHLGYPDYFRTLLGTAKILGVAVILGARRIPRLREWAYAGFTFDLVAATLSHAIRGEPAAAVEPLFALALLMSSYFLWHRPMQRKTATAATA